MELNYSFDATVLNSKNPKQVFAIIDNYSIQPISREEIYLINPNTQQTLILKDYMGFVVQQLEIYRSEEAHLNVICREMGLGNEAKADILNFFKQLENAGFLRTPADKLASLSKTDNQLLQSPPIVVVRTCGRVSMLKRFLESAAKNEAQFYADYQYIIIDDSSAEQVAANAVNIKASGLAITHFDKIAQTAYLDKLKSQFPAHIETLDYLLGEHPTHALATPYGRSWNWGILLSAGSGVVFLDDDCLLNAYASPIAGSSSAKLQSSNKDVVFLSKQHSIEQQLQRTNIDPIANLASLLGVNVSELKLTETSFVEAESKQLKRLQNQSKVILTTQGVAGEPGTASSTWLYNLNADSEARFIGENPTQYQQNKTSRFAWVGYPEPRISFSDSHSMVARAMDNRQLMPATLPVMRNEDAIFTHLVNYLYPNDVAYENAWAIEHLPEIERNWDDSDLDKPIGFNHAGAIGVILKELLAVSANTDLSTRLQLASKALATISQQTEADFKAWLYGEQQAFRAMKIHLLQSLLQTHGNAPDYWKTDLQRQIEPSIHDNKLHLPDDLSVADLQTLFKLYADGLALWPTLWDYSQNNQ